MDHHSRRSISRSALAAALVGLVLLAASVVARAQPQAQAQAALGDFEGHGDVGSPKLAGAAT